MSKRLVKCGDILKQICEKAGKSIRSKECELMRRHMQQCPNCHAYYDSIRKTIELYQAEPDPKFPAKLRTNLFAILKTELR